MAKTVIEKTHRNALQKREALTSPAKTQVAEEEEYDWAPKPGDPDYPAYLRYRQRMDEVRPAFAIGGAKAASEAMSKYVNGKSN